MIHNTHSAFGAALMETVLVSQHAPLVWQAGAAVIVAGFVAPFPDIDHPESWVRKHVPFGGLIGGWWQHRTFTHGIFLTIALYLLLYFTLPIPLWAATGLFVGWVSHWVIDLANPEGVMLFYPIKMWVRFPRFMTVEVNGLGERIIYMALRIYATLLGLSYLFIHIRMPIRIPIVEQFCIRVVQAVDWPLFGHFTSFLHIQI